MNRMISPGFGNKPQVQMTNLLLAFDCGSLYTSLAAQSAAETGKYLHTSSGSLLTPVFG